jgi:hypothetical protein
VVDQEEHKALFFVVPLKMREETNPKGTRRGEEDRGGGGGGRGGGRGGGGGEGGGGGGGGGGEERDKKEQGERREAIPDINVEHWPRGLKKNRLQDRKN